MTKRILPGADALERRRFQLDGHRKLREIDRDLEQILGLFGPDQLARFAFARDQNSAHR